MDLTEENMQALSDRVAVLEAKLGDASWALRNLVDVVAVLIEDVELDSKTHQLFDHAVVRARRTL